MNTKLRSAILVVTVGLPFFLCGCAAEQVQKVDAQSGLVTDAMDAQDFDSVSEHLASSMLNSGCLNNVPRTPAILVISRVTDKTAQGVDVDLLTKNVGAALQASGKIQVTTVTGVGGRASDVYAQGTEQENEFVNGKAPVQPDYSLSGKIIEEYTQINGQSEHVYTFQFSLTDLHTGLSVWEHQEQIAKLSNRPAVSL